MPRSASGTAPSTSSTQYSNSPVWLVNAAAQSRGANSASPGAPGAAAGGPSGCSCASEKYTSAPHDASGFPPAQKSLLHRTPRKGLQHDPYLRSSRNSASPGVPGAGAVGSGQRRVAHVGLLRPCCCSCIPIRSTGKQRPTCRNSMFAAASKHAACYKNRPLPACETNGLPSGAARPVQLNLVKSCSWAGRTAPPRLPDHKTSISHCPAPLQATGCQSALHTATHSHNRHASLQFVQVSPGTLRAGPICLTSASRLPGCYEGPTTALPELSNQHTSHTSAVEPGALFKSSLPLPGACGEQSHKRVSQGRGKQQKQLPTTQQQEAECCGSTTKSSAANTLSGLDKIPVHKRTCQLKRRRVCTEARTHTELL